MDHAMLSQHFLNGLKINYAIYNVVEQISLTCHIVDIQLSFGISLSKVIDTIFCKYLCAVFGLLLLLCNTINLLNPMISIRK